MFEKKGARAFIGAMNLLAVGSPMLANQVAHSAVTDKKVEMLNVASLKSMESTWLRVPHACKARGFHASPVTLENKSISANVQNIYSSFGV